jgi:hypothetical protein
VTSTRPGVQCLTQSQGVWRSVTVRLYSLSKGLRELSLSPVCLALLQTRSDSVPRLSALEPLPGLSSNLEGMYSSRFHGHREALWLSGHKISLS